MPKQSGNAQTICAHKVRSQVSSAKTVEHAFLNFKQIISINNAHVVDSFPRSIFAIEGQIKPIERYGVNHIGLHPVKI